MTQPSKFNTPQDLPELPPEPQQEPLPVPHEHAPPVGWRAFFTREMLICVFLGFSSGMPLFVLINLVQAWLSSEGVDIKKIGLFSLMLMPYAWKFLWAPLVDRYAMPFLGRRRGWMFVLHLAVLACIAGFGWVNPKTDLQPVFVMALILALCSSTLDIVIDAYRREILHDNQQGLGNAIHVNAYKVAGLVPGALSLILADHLPWMWVFVITAMGMLPGLVMTLVVREPTVYGTPPKRLQEAVIEPFTEFISRHGWQSAAWVLAFIFLYKLGDSMAVSLATKFYLDLGFSKTEIGALGKGVGFWASIAGGFVGGAWMLSIGIRRALWVFGFLQWFAILPFAWLAQTGHSLPMLAFAIGFEAFAVGLGTAALVAYIASQTDTRYTATQFALFTSLAALPRTVMNSFTGYIVADIGWFNFFMLCCVLAIPGMLLLPKIAPWRNQQ